MTLVGGRSSVGRVSGQAQRKGGGEEGGDSSA